MKKPFPIFGNGREFKLTTFKTLKWDGNDENSSPYFWKFISKLRAALCSTKIFLGNWTSTLTTWELDCKRTSADQRVASSPAFTRSTVFEGINSSPLSSNMLICLLNWLLWKLLSRSLTLEQIWYQADFYSGPTLWRLVSKPALTRRGWRKRSWSIRFRLWWRSLAERLDFSSDSLSLESGINSAWLGWFWGERLAGIGTPFTKFIFRIEK